MYVEKLELTSDDAAELFDRVRCRLDDGWNVVGINTSFRTPRFTAKLRKVQRIERLRLSEWIVVNGFCATRVVAGTDPNVDGNRVAFIEKSPRVCVNGIWIEGPKGAGGSDADKPENELYGFYPPSREWADNLLTALGARLPVSYG